MLRFLSAVFSDDEETLKLGNNKLTAQIILSAVVLMTLLRRNSLILKNPLTTFKKGFRVFYHSYAISFIHCK